MEVFFLIENANAIRTFSMNIWISIIDELDSAIKLKCGKM